MKKNISVCVVSFNTHGLLRGCLNSLYRTAGEDLDEVIVVDNGSLDGSAQMVGTSFPQVKLVINQDNVGFARASNQALSRSEGDYILLLNPDTEVAPEALTQLRKFMESHSQVGAAGARLLNPAKTLQQSWGSFPSLTQFGVDYLFFGNVWRRPPVINQDAEPFEVDWLLGACLMIKREVLDKVGLLDERFFMFDEDKDWCLRIKESGWKVYYVPQAVVIHHGGQSTDQQVGAMHLEWYRSQLKFLAKHYLPVYRNLLRTVMILGTIERLLVWSLLSPLPLKIRPVAKQRLGAYWEILKTVVSPGGV